MVCRVFSKMSWIVLVLMMGLHAVIPLQVLKYQDLQSKMESFNGKNNSEELIHLRKDGQNYFRYLQPTGDRLYVGAMNYMFELNLTDLSLNKFAHFEIQKTANRTCYIQGNSLKRDCQNHIRVIMVMQNKTLFVCGTGAYSPQRYTLNSNLTVNSTDHGRGYCPFDPLDNATALYVENGNPGGGPAQYFGTYSDFLKADFAFWRRTYTYDGATYGEKLTDQEDSFWLKSPQFVGSFDMDTEVFFFFRETAVESTVSNKIYSRVGKVCKQDVGWGSMREKWLSFQKSRLLCSLPGIEHYYFDDIYDVYKSGDYFYALFYKRDAYYLDVMGISAICVYRHSDIVSSFSGDFQDRQTGTCNQWGPVNPSPRLDNCTLHKDTPDVFIGKILKYQLMSTDIEPVHGRPIYYKSGVQLLKLVVDNSSADDKTRNIYVASDEGNIYSLFMKDNDANPSTPLVEEHAVYSPFETQNTSYAIWSMKLQDNSLYIGTDYSVTKLDVSNMCDKYMFADTCILHTHCKWACTQAICYHHKNESCCDGKMTMDAGNITTDKDVREQLVDTGCVKNATSSLNMTICSGVYATLDINYPFSNMGQIEWRKFETILIFEDTCSSSSQCNSKYFLAQNTGSLIIKNVTQDDVGHYTAIDKTTKEILATFNIEVADNNDSIVDAWKQSFTDWSQTFNRWKGCAEQYLQTCKAPGS